MYIRSCFIYECGDIRRSIWRPKCPSRGVSGSLAVTAPLGTLTLCYYFSPSGPWLLHISYFIRVLIFPLLPVNFPLNVCNGYWDFSPCFIFYLDDFSKRLCQGNGGRFFTGLIKNFLSKWFFGLNSLINK